MPSHVPAWKKIAIKKSQANSETNDGKKDNLIDNDPLNVTTHLASGSLTRKEKKRILRGEPESSSKRKKVPKTSKPIKKEKLSKEERQSNKSKVLRDQLRYLIEFFLEKIDTQLPEELLNLENVKFYYGDIDSKNLKKDNEDDTEKVIDVWKFSKQKQNWLIKHFLVLDEISEEYDSLLISYFKDLKGGSKMELYKKSLKICQSWNDYTKDQQRKIEEMINNSDKESNEKDSGKEEPTDDKNATDKTEQEKEETKEEELPMPNKYLVHRCKKLIDEWVSQDESGEIKAFDLNNFKLD
ncbi:hypothetical protein TBLA_0D04880 [Henningerozyma blattae CBS 6284]|uniref:WKF domain-containing protein n=1 Tax=Henningerozyma blattae (strain ATCC 34711 / CBS 6284 / DSM 70876 / NBRC 10599 / NRRL Y-10934 / UCD 77-7) TaxID=1071380 RepID=I2H3N2_HENB6|nr:hypothetical protein TBLA_0D04880 [Tetrapisispora blattae CBS 6284]CCH60984.1 hypothetical protein TBLA_0D04880 [Tetrapisispora blattae CBS 6284]